MPEKQKYAEVAPLIPLPAAGKPVYTYLVPAGTKLYERVVVPFGRREVSGVVVSFLDKAPPYPVKLARSWDKVVLHEKQILFGYWIASVCRGALGYTLRLFFPPEIKRHPKDATRPIAAPKIVSVADRGALKILQKIKAEPGAVIIGDAEKRYAYLSRLARTVADMGQQTLVLVPELRFISDIAQTLSPLFSVTEVAVYHGELTIKDARRVWDGAVSGATKVVIGTQKSLFLPLANLGLAVLEAESYPTHKLWDAYPRLDNRAVLPHFARIYGAKIIYAGSRPSIELYHRILRKEVRVLANEPLPARVEIISAAFADRAKHLPIPGGALSLIKYWVKRRSKVLVLLSRKNDALAPLLKRATGARVQELYAGSRKRGQVAASALAKSTRVIVGTSAVLRYLPPGSVGHVVLLAPERAFSYPDYRSLEKSLWLVQAAQELALGQPVLIAANFGRLARAVFDMDWQAVYDRELKMRAKYRYPPFNDIARLSFTAKNNLAAWKKAVASRGVLDVKKPAPILVSGPFHELTQKNITTAYILLRGTLPDIKKAAALAHADSVDYMPEKIL